MTSIEIALQYFDAWNHRDPAAAWATFAPHGTYQDPSSNGPVSGDAFLTYMGGLIAAFPDVSFEIVSAGLVGPDLVAAQWIMRGTNTGSMMGLPPTGKSIELAGADFIRTADGKIASVIGYFDSRGIPDQLGMQVVVQPRQIGPFSFGTCSRAYAGNRAKPGAISVTMLEARSPDAAAKVSQQSQAIEQDMLGMKGFIGLTGLTIGTRMMTVAAWETPSDPLLLLKPDGNHGNAIRMFHGGEVAQGGYTSVWTPLRLNTMWTRCPACGRMADSAKPACPCGAALPDALPYW